MASADDINVMISYRYAELAAVVLHHAIRDATQARSPYRREEARFWLTCGVGRQWIELLGGEAYMRSILSNTTEMQSTLFEFDFGG